MSRVTPALVSSLLARYAGLQGLTGRAKPDEDWTFTVEVVPGLKDPRSGSDAWAVVVPKPNPKSDGGTAHVRVRDIDATPIPGFDGDPMLEIRVTISHELFHCLVAEAVARSGGALTIPAEEKIVEAAAQAVVRSEGTADARIMARAAKAIPEALRARVAAKVSARAATRARGGQMDPEMVMKALDALEGGDSAAALEILKGLIATAAAGGAPPASDPAPVEAREENTDMNDPNKPAAAPPAGPPAARPMARVDHEAARARKAADSLNASAIRARVHAAKVVDGLDISPALEKEILAESDIDGAEKLLRVVALSKGDGSRARAEGTARPVATPAPKAAKYDADALVKEGINPIMAKHIAEETNEEAADLALKAARARIASSASPWPTARKPAGGAS